MNPIVKALEEIKFRIPPEILDRIFIDRHFNEKFTEYSLDSRIEYEVIRQRVLVDCDLVGGTEAMVNVASVRPEQIDVYMSVLRIPKELTQGRSITSVLSVHFGLSAYTNYPSTQAGVSAVYSNDMMKATNALLQSNMSQPVSSTARTQIIGENTILIKDSNPLPGFSFLRCILANDFNMNHISLRSYLPFADLCVLATKSHIYNTYRITLDKGALFAGYDLPIIKEIIDEYKDSDDLYREFLKTKWTKISKMNDTETHTRFLMSMSGGYR